MRRNGKIGDMTRKIGVMTRSLVLAREIGIVSPIFRALGRSRYRRKDGDMTRSLVLAHEIGIVSPAFRFGFPI